LFLGLFPDDPNVIVGRSLRMTCLLRSDEYHAKDLKFEFQLFNRVRGRTIHVPASCIYAVNQSVAKLNYTDMRPRFDRATIICYHRNRPSLRAMQIIKVGRECFYLHFVLCVSPTNRPLCIVEVILWPWNVCFKFCIWDGGLAWLNLSITCWWRFVIYLFRSLWILQLIGFFYVERLFRCAQYGQKKFFFQKSLYI